MKRILSFFMVFVLLFNFVLPRKSEAVAPVVGALLSNPKTYVAVGSLLASAGIVYENADSLKAGVTDFLNKSAEIREHVHNAMLISGIYVVNGIQKNIFPVNQELYNSAVDYASSYNGSVSSVPIESEYVVNDVTYTSIDYIIPYNKTIGVNYNGNIKSSVTIPLDTSIAVDYASSVYGFDEVTSDIGLAPFIKINPTADNWSNNSNFDNSIYFKILGNDLSISHYSYNKWFAIHENADITNYSKTYYSLAPYTPVYISAKPEYSTDSNGVWYKGLRLYLTFINNSSGYHWYTSHSSDLIFKCNTPTGISSDPVYNHPDISAKFTKFNESTGLYEPIGAVAPQVQYSTYTPTLDEWDYNADEQVGIVLPSGSIDNYVGTPESVTTGELTTYTGEKTGELDWTSTPSEGEGEEGGGSISGEFDIGEWLTGTGAGTLSGTLDNAFSNVNAKIDSLTNSISNVFNPELSWENSNFRWFDFIILFLDVILACIRLTIRFLVFVVTLTQIAATPLIENSYILDGIEFLKNLSVPNTNFSLWGLITSFETAMFGITAFAFIKRKFHF